MRAMSIVLRAAADGHQPELLLRPWSPGDAAALLEIYRDPVMAASARRPVETEQAAAAWIAVRVQDWAHGSRLSFAVVQASAAGPAAAGRILANVALKDCVAGRDRAEVGYWTATTARRLGVASAAVLTVTTWAFERFGPRGLARIELLHSLGNNASCRVAQRCGYELTSVLDPYPPDFPEPGHLHTRSGPVLAAASGGGGA
jgi:RimJ/RimL family protein N-acetyltransferase